MIEIAEIDVWVPIMDAWTDVIAKKHVNWFLNPDACEILELTKIPNPIACWTVAKSKSFLMMWLIFNLRKMNANDAKADMITTIPNTMGIKRNVTPIIFALNVNLVLKFQSNQIFLVHTLVYTNIFYNCQAVTMETPGALLSTSTKYLNIIYLLKLFDKLHLGLNALAFKDESLM